MFAPEKYVAQMAKTLAKHILVGETHREYYTTTPEAIFWWSGYYAYTTQGNQHKATCSLFRELCLAINQYSLNLRFTEKYTRHQTLFRWQINWMENGHQMWRTKHTINTSPPSAACMRRQIGSALVQIMACRLGGANPLSVPMLVYCQLDP